MPQGVFGNTFLSDQAAGRTVCVYGQFDASANDLVADSSNDETLTVIADDVGDWTIQFGATANDNPFVGKPPVAVATIINAAAITTSHVVRVHSFGTSTDPATGETTYTNVRFMVATNAGTPAAADIDFMFMIWGQRKR